MFAQALPMLYRTEKGKIMQAITTGAIKKVAAIELAKNKADPR